MIATWTFAGEIVEQEECDTIESAREQVDRWVADCIELAFEDDRWPDSPQVFEIEGDRPIVLVPRLKEGDNKGLFLLTGRTGVRHLDIEYRDADGKTCTFVNGVPHEARCDV